MEEPRNGVAEQVAAHAGIQQANVGAAQSRQLQYQMEDQEKNLAEAQLDVEETITKIHHLLKQDVLKVSKESGVLEWFEISDKKKKVLTDEGVDRIMQLVQSYINKETLLSNFDAETIKRRMLEFSLALSGLIFMKYEIYFSTPSMEECYDILTDRIDSRIGKRKMSYKLRGIKFDEDKTRKEIIGEFEQREEYELEKIRIERRKLNLREYETLFIQIRALVEATHNRAWKGEERGSLRRHFNISEVIGGRSQGVPEKRGFFGFGK